jgi:hypothetical protein
MNSDTRIRSIGLSLLGTIAVWVTLMIGNSFYLCANSARWPKLSVRIVSSSITTGTSNMGRWWAPEVEYEYGVNGRIYHATNIRYFMPAIFQEEGARAIQAAYPQNRFTSAAYDPADPTRAVLEPGIPSNLWVRPLVPLFLWSLCGFIFYGLKSPNRKPELRSATEDAGCD